MVSLINSKIGLEAFVLQKLLTTTTLCCSLGESASSSHGVSAFFFCKYARFMCRNATTEGSSSTACLQSYIFAHILRDTELVFIINASCVYNQVLHDKACHLRTVSNCFITFTGKGIEEAKYIAF